MFGYVCVWRPTVDGATRSRSGARPVRGTAAALPPASSVMSVGNALAVFDRLRAEGGPAPGPDGVSYSDLSRSEAAACFRKLMPKVLAGDYRPGPARVVEIMKASGGTRELRLAGVLDRIVGRVLYEAVGPFLDATFAPWSYGFRPGRSAAQLLARIKASAERDGLTVVTADDVRKAFDCVPVGPLLRLLDEALPDPWYRAEIAAVVMCDGGKEVGIDQGGSLSPLLLNLYLDCVLDRPLAAAAGGTARLLRYADNVGYLTNTEEEGERLLERSQGLLAGAGLALKGDPGRPIDLRRESLSLLGFTVGMTGGRVRFGVGEAAWRRFGEKLAEVRRGSDATRQAAHIVRGWLQAAGPALDGREESLLRRLNQTLTRSGIRGAMPRTSLEAWARTALDDWRRTADATFRERR